MWNKIESHLSPDNIRCWVAALGGRRFLLTVGAGIVTAILAWHGKITPEIYRDVVLGTVGIYIAGSTFQKNTQIKADVEVAKEESK